ncbi:MAG: hypothetical protein Q4C63_03915 [Eubacteriales bacterium]|nr:hypothetical protein [Eubacteriales bacterium]
MKEKKPLIIEILAGIVLICAGWVIKADYYSTMIFSMGVGIAFASIVQLLRITYWKNPKRYTEYEAKKREAYINSVDERKQYLRVKAGHVAYQIMTFSLLILSLVLALLRVEAWVTAMVFLLFVCQWLVGIIAFRILAKRM